MCKPDMRLDCMNLTSSQSEEFLILLSRGFQLLEHVLVARFEFGPAGTEKCRHA
jgi:hypothetical protein